MSKSIIECEYLLSKGYEIRGLDDISICGHDNIEGYGLGGAYVIAHCLDTGLFYTAANDGGFGSFDCVFDQDWPKVIDMDEFKLFKRKYIIKNTLTIGSETDYLHSIGFELKGSNKQIDYYEWDIHSITHYKEDNTFSLTVAGTQKGSFGLDTRGSFESIFLLKFMDYKKYRLMKRQSVIKKILNND